VIHLQMADQPELGTSSRKRPGENPGYESNLGSSEEPMDTEEAGPIGTDNEKNTRKKMKTFHSEEKLVIHSEKSKV
jgi:hypothetical protein